MTFFLATDSIPSDKSNPMISEASVFSANFIAKSPVPVAMSKILSGWCCIIYFKTFFLHFKSVPKEIKRFRPS